MKCLNAMVLKCEWCLITGEFLTQRTLKTLFIAYSLATSNLPLDKIEFHAYMKCER